jgi:hypothetical protein
MLPATIRDLNLFKKLPQELIINHILPYAMKPQPFNHLADIRHYYESLEELKLIYLTRYEPVDEEDRLGWIDNDLQEYLDDFPSTKYRVFKQIFRMCDETSPDVVDKSIDQYLYYKANLSDSYYDSINPITDSAYTHDTIAYSLWGALTEEEREQFLTLSSFYMYP